MAAGGSSVTAAAAAQAPSNKRKSIAVMEADAGSRATVCLRAKFIALSAAAVVVAPARQCQCPMSSGSVDDLLAAGGGRRLNDNGFLNGYKVVMSPSGCISDGGTCQRHPSRT